MPYVWITLLHLRYMTTKFLYLHEICMHYKCSVNRLATVARRPIAAGDGGAGGRNTTGVAPEMPVSNL